MKRAPGPKGTLIWGSLADLNADSLGLFAQAAQEHGDVVRFHFGPVMAHLINRPEFIEQVLSRHVRNYDKATRSADRIAATTGDSLLSANSDAWGRHRRLIQPAFQPKCFQNLAPVIDTLLDPMLANWRATGTIDIVDEMMQLVIAVAIKVLFSSDIDPQQINDPLGVLLADTWRRIEAPLDPSMLSRHLHRRAFKDAVRAIDDIVLDLIQARRTADARPDDVLSRLLSAHEDSGDAQLDDTELRDAAVTLLLAGHETTANALSWAFIHAADGFETAAPADIFAEAIRLHPSIWVIERRVIADDNIGGFHIPRGSSVLISPYTMHRHPDYWPAPDVFDPSRFGAQNDRPRHAYIPVGLGPHRCVGLHLANGIACHVIARVFESFDMRLVPDQNLDHDPGITLRHKSVVMMQVQPKGQA